MGALLFLNGTGAHAHTALGRERMQRSTTERRGARTVKVRHRQSLSLGGGGAMGEGGWRG